MSRGNHDLLAVVAGAIVLVGSVAPAHAALTTDVCLAKKLKQWGNLRKCQAVEHGKALQGKPSDPGKCEIKLAERLAKLSEKATSAGIACRYADNGDGTATDYDTGLQWEQKTDDGSVHDKENGYNGPTNGTLHWSDTVALPNVPFGVNFQDGSVGVCTLFCSTSESAAARAVRSGL